MKQHTVALTITSLLSVLLAFHLSDDIVLGIEPGGVAAAVPYLHMTGVGLVGSRAFHQRDEMTPSR